jgi:hypothetical protein
MDQGIDSLSAVEFRNRLAALGNSNLPVTVVFDYPTIRDIADFIKPKGEPTATPAQTPTHAHPCASVAETMGKSRGVTGFSCRFPGAASCPHSFNAKLNSGTEGVIQVPFSRWEVDEYYEPDGKSLAKSYAKHGSFIQGAELFDNRFFGITKLEACSMDP